MYSVGSTKAAMMYSKPTSWKIVMNCSSLAVSFRHSQRHCAIVVTRSKGTRSIGRHALSHDTKQCPSRQPPCVQELTTMRAVIGADSRAMALSIE